MSATDEQSLKWDLQAFDHDYKAAERLGLVDSIGGHEYRRMRSERIAEHIAWRKDLRANPIDWNQFEADPEADAGPA